MYNQCVVQKKQTAIRISDVDEKLIVALSKKKGVNKTSIIVLAVREMAEREGVPIPTETNEGG